MQDYARVPLVIEGSVPDMGDLVCRQLENFGNVSCPLIDSALLRGTDVVDFAHLATVQDDIKGLGHILHIQIAAHPRIKSLRTCIRDVMVNTVISMDTHACMQVDYLPKCCMHYIAMKH